MGGSALFAAMFGSVVAIEIMHFTRRFNLNIRMPDSVPTAIADSFALLVPVAIVGLLFGTFRYVVGFDLIGFLIVLLAPLQSFFGDNLGGVMLLILFVTLF